MGYWENTAYIHCANLARIAEVITAVFAREGVLPIETPPPRNPEPMDPMQYGSSQDTSIWGIALIPSRDGWTAVKTAPFELLLERPSGGTKARLAAIAMELQADCGQLNVYDGSESILFECSSTGKIRASGAAEQCSFIERDANYSPIRFHNEPLEESSLGIIRFTEGEYENTVQVECLIPHAPLDIPGALALYFQRNSFRK